jgi:hypothetical protein
MMQIGYHHCMRTTLTLDDDLVAKVKAICGRTGESFRVVLNRLLRTALNERRDARPRKPFRIQARPLGLRAGLNLDSVADLLEQVDGPEKA